MSEEAKMILELLREGKINADEATRLLAAVAPPPSPREFGGVLLDDLRDAARGVAERARKEAKEAVRRANEVMSEELSDTKERARQAAQQARETMKEQLRAARLRLKEFKQDLKERQHHAEGKGEPREELEEVLENIQDEVEDWQDELEELQDEVEELQDELEEMEEEIAEDTEEEETEQETVGSQCKREGGLLASVLSALGGGGSTYRWTDELSGELPNVPVPRVLVRGVNGRIIVEPSSDSKWHLTIDKSARAGTALEAEALARNLYTVERTADGLTILAKKVFGQARAVNFHLRLPPDRVYDLDQSSVNGSVNVKGVKTKRLRASTTNGKVTAESLAEEISLSSVNGRVELIGGAADTKCRTVNGSLAVTCPKLQAGKMTLDTVNGSVSLRLGTSDAVGVKIMGTNVHGSVQAETTDMTIAVERRTVGRKLVAESKGNFAHWLEVEAKSVHGSINITRLG